MMSNVLIIEDEVQIAELIQLFLKSEKISSKSVLNGEDGLKYLSKNSFDLIILDINLPGINGFDLLKKIRIDNKTPVIIVSARTEDEDILNGLNIGADEFVKKPFNPKILMAQIKATIRRSKLYGNSGNKMYKFADYVLDYDGYILKKSNKIIPLSTLEMEVLRYLILNAGETLTLEELYKQIWEQEYGDLKIVSVYIQRLRKKIELDYQKPRYINTIFGKGYQFSKDLIK